MVACCVDGRKLSEMYFVFSTVTVNYFRHVYTNIVNSCGSDSGRIKHSRSVEGVAP